MEKRPLSIMRTTHRGKRSVRRNLRITVGQQSRPATAVVGRTRAVDTATTTAFNRPGAAIGTPPVIHRQSGLRPASPQEQGWNPQ